MLLVVNTLTSNVIFVKLFLVMPYIKSKNDIKKVDIIDQLFDGLIGGMIELPLYLGGKSVKIVKKILRKNDNRIILGSKKGNEVSIFPQDLNTHLLVTGETGAGKSGFSINLAKSLINSGVRTLFLDPHGVAIQDIYSRVKYPKKVIYLSLNQQNKHLGYNPFFKIGAKGVLENQSAHLLNSIFYDEINTGYQVFNGAKFIISSVIYFHNAYLDWLIRNQKIEVTQAGQILSNKQITINDIANLKNNPLMVDLLIEILGDENNQFYRPDLVRQWVEIREKKSFDSGMQGALGRFSKLAGMYEAQLFFESNGFNVIEEIKKGNSVLCDLKGLEELTMSIISKIIFSSVFSNHKKGSIKGQTIMIIDEAKLVKVPNLGEIIEQARKFKLGLVLLCQYVTQFENKTLESAINNTIVSNIQFRNKEGRNPQEKEKLLELEKRHFIFETSGKRYEGYKTIDYDKPLREFKTTELGLTTAELEKRMTAKTANIYNYFLKNYKI